MLKKILIVTMLLLISSMYCQLFESKKWQIGIGGGLVKFSETDAKFIGDRHLSQIPRFNLSRKIDHNFSLDGAISFGSFDSSVNLITTNNVPYFSLDMSSRYHFYKGVDKLEPYVFAGGSLVNSSRKMSPTINIGVGTTYWFSKFAGVNTNIYYKHSLESFESMRSHFQFTLGVVFGVNFGKGGKPSNFGSTRCYFNQHK